MTDLALAQAASRPSGSSSIILVVAVRNLWRRKLRTWMSACGIAFAILLVSVFTGFQAGIYGAWIESATGLMVGHMQLQHPDYQDNPKVGHAVGGASALVRDLEAAPGVVAVAPRAEAFVLASVGERSYGALVTGVDPEREAAMFTLPHQIRQGAYLPRADSAFLGAALAANLGVSLGDAMFTLGSSEEGGVAVMELTVDGIFESGRPELDRSIMHVRLAAMQEAFSLGDAVHRIVANASDAGRVEAIAPALRASLPDEVRLLDWDELLPEVRQAIQLDATMAEVTYWLLMAVVVVAVVNAFIITVFERTREFGMLLAIGMRPNGILGMLLTEAFSVWVIGAILGVALSLAVVIPLSVVGISLPELADDEGMQAMAAIAMMPDTLRPAVSLDALLRSPLVMLAGTLLAALVPGLRVRRMQPVVALREEE